MRKRALLLGIHAEPPRWLQIVYMSIVPVIAIAGYYWISSNYLADNPHGKLLPSFMMMLRRFLVLTSFSGIDFELNWVWGFIPVPDITLIGSLFWGDTAISLFLRLLTGVAIASAVGLILGLNIAMFRTLQFLVLPWVTVLSFVPVVAVMPILLIVLGIGEEAKIVLIILGLVFIITLSMYEKTREIAQELLVNARTLGATDLGLTYRVVLPMVIPDLLQTMRLNMGIAWYCLLMGEAIAAQQGLGYRIFLFRRVGPDMAGILPYVICITLFAFAIYYLLGCIERRLFPWKTDGEKQ